MKLPIVLSKYFGKQFIISVLVTLAVMGSIVLVVDTLELMRRASGKPVPFYLIMEMAFLKLPNMLEKVAPFAFLMGGVLSLLKLGRNHELIASRAAGISVWQFMLPMFAITISAGIFVTTIFNPLSSAMLSRFEQLEGKYFSGKASLLAVSSSGLWLRQFDATDESRQEIVIHALRVSQPDMQLSDVILFIFNSKNDLTMRIDAKKAALNDGFWLLDDTLITSPDRPSVREARLKVNTNLTVHQIQDSFASPETLSFWELGSFINVLQNAGFSAIRHSLHWHSILSLPLYYCAMTLLAAGFVLQHRRGKRAGLLIVAAVFTGFAIYFVSDLVMALGVSGAVSVFIAAWAPVIAYNLVGVALLLHIEDG